jgi:hypothetical protein
VAAPSPSRVLKKNWGFFSLGYRIFFALWGKALVYNLGTFI